MSFKLISKFSVLVASALLCLASFLLCFALLFRELKTRFRPAPYEVWPLLLVRNLAFYCIFWVSGGKRVVFLKGRNENCQKPCGVSSSAEGALANNPFPHPRKATLVGENTVQGQTLKTLFGTPGGRRSRPSHLQAKLLLPARCGCTDGV